MRGGVNGLIHTDGSEYHHPDSNLVHNKTKLETLYGAVTASRCEIIPPKQHVNTKSNSTVSVFIKAFDNNIVIH